MNLRLQVQDYHVALQNREGKYHVVLQNRDGKYNVVLQNREGKYPLVLRNGEGKYHVVIQNKEGKYHVALPNREGKYHWLSQNTEGICHMALQNREGKNVALQNGEGKYHVALPNPNRDRCYEQEELTQSTHDGDRRQKRLRLRRLPEPGEKQPALHHPETQPTRDDDHDDDKWRLNKFGHIFFCFWAVTVTVIPATGSTRSSFDFKSWSFQCTTYQIALGSPATIPAYTPAPAPFR